MKYDVYSKISVTDDCSTFEFISTGKNGAILKRVVFHETIEGGAYNLSLGDVSEDYEMDDHVVTNNGDRNKVLATVATIIEAYTSMFPDRWIIFKGSSEDRTRLYRMAIGLHMDELSPLYEIWVYKDGQLVPFSKNLKVSAFLIKRKI